MFMGIRNEESSVHTDPCSNLPKLLKKKKKKNYGEHYYKNKVTKGSIFR